MQFSYVTPFRELVDSSKDTGRQLFAGTDTKPAIAFPPEVTAQWEEQVHIIKNLSSMGYILLQSVYNYLTEPCLLLAIILDKTPIPLVDCEGIRH